MTSENPMSFQPPQDYTLIQLLGDNAHTSIWLAEQHSVQRHVVLEQWRDLADPAREDFIAAVRVKASIDHPIIASVYEAIDDPNHCLFTREWLPGESLSSMIQRGRQLLPAQVANILRRLAEAHLHLEERNIATSPLSLAHIYLSEHQVLRIANLGTIGSRDSRTSRHDIETIAQSLLPLIEQGMPGYTRVQTLLHWMSGANPDQVLQWKDIRHYADQIEQQLATPVSPTLSSTQPALLIARRKFPLTAILVTSAIVFLGLVSLLVVRKSKQTPPKSPPLTGPIMIPDGSYLGPDGTKVTIRKFWLASHEVTIGEYHEFLESLQVLDDEQRKIYDHEAQPPTKTSHRPEDWDAIFHAAENQLTRNSQALSLECPVFGVDWWDAHAYCEWKRGRLPTQEEWHAAMRWKTNDVAALKSPHWCPVSQLDQNGAGFFGMGGGVSEWMRKPANNPSNPLGARQWVIMGASYANPQQGALAREWNPDRNARRADLGFRIAFDHLPE
jgi:hypothetical protein